MNRPETTRHDGRHKSMEAGPRAVEVGLGGHDAGVSGVDEGSETHRFCVENWDDLTMSKLTSFSGGPRDDNCIS